MKLCTTRREIHPLTSPQPRHGSNHAAPGSSSPPCHAGSNSPFSFQEAITPEIQASHLKRRQLRGAIGRAMLRPSLVDNCSDGASPSPVSRPVSVSHSKDYRVNEKSSRIWPSARQLLGTNVGLPHAYRYGINQAFYELHDCTPYARGRSFHLFLRCKIRTVYHQSRTKAVGAALDRALASAESRSPTPTIVRIGSII